MTRRTLLIVLGFFFLNSCQEAEYEEEEIPTGYIGEARVNPYLAATRFLNEGGWNAQSERVWSDFGYETSTIVMPASFLATQGIAMRALDWVEGGGLLVITMAGGESDINDFSRNDWNWEYEEEETIGLDFLLEELGVKVISQDYEEKSSGEKKGHLSKNWNLSEISLTQGEVNHDLDVEFEGNIGLETDDGEIWEGDRRASRMATAPYFSGTVMLLSHARPFRNAYVDRADHATFLEVLAEWNNEGNFVFLYGSEASFFDLLWRHAWQAVLAGAVLLFCWLWMSIPRFGPVKKDDFTYRRPYGDGLKAAATFLWRRGAIAHYINPLRSQLQADFTPDKVSEKLAQESGLTPDAVKEALYSQPTKDPSSITRMVRQIQFLLKR